MRIFIFGNSGVGKSYSAIKIAEEYSLPLCHLDDLVWENSVKRPHQIRGKILNDFLINDNWVIEGMSHSEWMHEVYKRADLIFYIKPSAFINNLQIVKRYIKKKLNIDKGFKENIKYLKSLKKIRKEYVEKTIPEIKDNISKFNKTLIMVKNYKNIIKILNKTTKNTPIKTKN